MWSSFIGMHGRLSNVSGTFCRRFFVMFPRLSITFQLETWHILISSHIISKYKHTLNLTIDKIYNPYSRCGSRIWSRGGPQLLRPKVADVAKRSRASEASILRPGSRARLRALEAFGFLMLKYAFSHILETLFLLFKTSILTPKVDKNRALDFTSINLKHSHMLHLFLIFMKSYALIEWLEVCPAKRG